MNVKQLLDFIAENPKAREDPEIQKHLAELDTILEANPLEGYEPHGKQSPFHAAKVRTKVFLGGNRSGKSTAGVVDNLIQACDKDVVPKHLLKYKIWEPPFYCRIITPDFTRTLKAVAEAIRKWCPRSQYKGGSWEHAYRDKDKIFEFANGSFFEFLTYEQDIDKHGGTARHRCVDEETRILSRKGWAGPDDLAVGDEILTLDTESGAYEWKPVTKLYVGYEDRMTRLRSRNNFDLLVTHDHRWWVRNKKTGKSYFTTTDRLKTTEQLVVSGTATQEPDNPNYSDAEVALTGWLVTDGWVAGSNMFITQSLSYNGAKCEEIEGWLSDSEHRIEDRPYHADKCEGTQRNYAIKGKLRERLHGIVGAEKELPLDFIAALGTRQRELLLDAIIKGDGQRFPSGRWSLTSSNPQHHQAFLYLAALSGQRIKLFPTRHGWSVINGKTAKSDRYDYTRTSVCELERTEVEGRTRVWCPTTENGTFVAERDGAVFATGNCHFDEEPDGERGEAVREEASMRLIDYRGDEIFTFTPLNGLGWTFDEFWEEKGPEVEKDVWLNEQMVVIRVDMEDNPVLDKEEIEFRLSKLPEKQRSARKSGNFEHFKGLVYEMYDPALHVVPKPAREHVKDLEIRVAIDPGMQVTAVQFGGFDKENSLLIFDELHLSDTDAIPKNAAEAIKQKLKWWGIDPRYFLIDPSARNRSLTDAQQVQELYRLAGIRCHPAQNDVEMGVFEMQRRLENKDAERNPAPLYHVAENCKHTREEFPRYRLDIQEDGKFKVVKRGDHHMDGDRYLAASKPLPTKPRPKSAPRRQVYIPGTAPPFKPEPRREVSPLGRFA